MSQTSSPEPIAAPNAACKRQPPRFRLEAFEYADRAAVRHLEDLLEDLSAYVDKFYYAVKLFDAMSVNYHSASVVNSATVEYNALDHYLSWMRIAARDGAMTLFHIAKTLDAINSSISKCKLIFELIDRQALKSARLLFFNSFSNFSAIRHSVAHSGELFASEKAKKENSFSGDYEGLGMKIERSIGTIITEGLYNRTFTNTYDGEIVSYDISWENWKILDDMLCALFLVFTSPDR